jgi:hypothetical protein
MNMTSFLRLSAWGLCAALAVTTARAQWWNPNIAPKEKNAPVVYDSNLWQAARLEVQRALGAQDFAKLERMHEEFLALHLARGDGRGMLAAFQSGMNDWVGSQPHAKARQVAQEWNARFPASSVAPVTQAFVWYQAAWRERGSGYANTVTPEAWRLFRDNLEKTLQSLDAAAERGRATPLWYDLALAAAGSLGQPRTVQQRVFEDGVKRFPLYRPLYGTRVNYLLPQWGGDYALIDASIRDAVARTQVVEGTALYASLYAQVAGSFRGKDFFKETRASWKLMRHAYEDGMREPADHDWLNAYATYACVARDGPATRRLLAMLGRNASLGPGPEGFSPDACEMLAERS